MSLSTEIINLQRYVALVQFLFRRFFFCVASDLNLRAPLAVKQSVLFRGGTEAQRKDKYTASIF